MDSPGLGAVTRATFWSGLERTVNRLATLAIFIMLGRLLAPEHFGLAALAGAFTSLVEIFVDQGFSKALVQRRSLSRAALDTAFWTAAATGVGLTAAGVLAAPLVAQVLGEQTLVGVIRWLSAGFLFTALSTTQQALLQRAFAFRTLAVRRLSATVVGGVVGIALAAQGAGVWALVGQTLARALVGTVVLWAAASWRPGLAVSRGEFAELFRFGVNVVGIEFLNFFTRQGDSLLIGTVLGPVALGYYTVATRVLSVMIEVLVGTINQVVTPTFSRLQDDPAATRRAFYGAIRLCQAVALPAFVGVAVLAPELLTVAFGPRWAPSAPVLQALALLGGIQSSTYFDRGVLFAAGRPHIELRLTLAATIGNLVAFALAMPWGIVGIAVALLVRSLVFWPIRLWALHRVAGIEPAPYLRQWARPLLVSALMAAALLALRGLLGPALLAPPVLAAAVFAGGLVYVAALRVFARDVTRELLRAARTLRSPRPAMQH